MATRARARELFDRSRVLLDRSRVAAAQILDPQRPALRRAIEAAPSAPVAPSVPISPPASPPAAVPDESLMDVCASIALRDLNLIDTLLSNLEAMERGEDDSHRLDQLYRLDHLAARLRRNAENLRVLVDHDADEDGGDTISVLDTVRAAMSSIDQYAKVSIGRVASLGVVGFAANDLSRVLTELLDNATQHSPPNADVRVSGHLTEQGSVLVRIEDDGIGLPADRLAELNDRLSRSRRLDDAAVRHMGLAVVRRLAERHGLRVSLDHRVPNGTTAAVLVPPSLVTELPEGNWSGERTVPVNGRHHVRQPQHDSPAFVPDTVAAAEPPATPPAGLPRRDGPPMQRPAAESSAQRPSPTPRPPSPAVSGTTSSGLPRRVSRSIKPGAAGTDGPSTALGAGPEDGQDQFLADLDGFTDGEMAANARETGAEDGDAK